MTDAEKSAVAQASHANTVDIDPEKPSLNNSDSETVDEKPEKEKTGSLKDYFRIFHYADRLDIFLYIVALVGGIAVGATLPLMTLVFGSSTASFNTQATSQANPQSFTSQINHLVLYFVYLFIGRFVIGYVATLSICIAATRTTRALRKAFLESLLRQEIQHFDGEGNGSPATQVTTNGNRVNQGIAEKLYTLAQGLSLLISSYAVALSVQWKLALIVMTIMPATFVIYGGVISYDIPIESRITKIYSSAAVLAQDAVSSIKTIHAFGAQEKILGRYDEYLQKAHNEGKKKSIIFGILFSAGEFLVLSGTALAFWQGYRMFQSGEIDNVGTVFTVILSVLLGSASLMLILPQIQAISNASSAASELFSIIDKHSLLDPLSPDGMQPAECIGDIQIHDLRFAYPTRSTAPVLQGLNLSIPAGKTTALVGPSGCGKSTLVGLLERWYQPTSGQILLDGHDIAEYNTKWLRSNFRLVQQEPTLFRGTILQNVVKGLVGEQRNLPAEAQMKLVQEACMSSNAHDFIIKLPDGYHTQVGERASMLSGGQRQRIAIARSIVSNPKVLLLDEATSALDPRAERVVQDALQRVSANKTTLIIAHKLATVMAADSIAVMSKGKVIEQGTHRELLKLNGLYAAMVRAQDLGADGKAEKMQEASEDGSDGNEPLEKTLMLQRTKSETLQQDVERQVSHLSAGTLKYPLAKCIWILLKEHPDLYKWYLATIIGGVIGGLRYPAQAVIFSRIINVFTLQGPEAKTQADFFALMFFVLAIANLLGYFAIGWTCNTIGQNISHRVRHEMMSRMMLFDQDFFDRPENSSGSITSRLSSVPTSLLELISQNLGLLVNIFVNVLSSSILGIAFGWKLGLVMVFGGFSLVVAAGYTRIRLDQKLEAATEERFASSAGLATEAVTSIRTISFLTQETQIIEEYNATLGEIVAQVIPKLAIMLIPYALSQSIDMLVMGLGFWYGSRLVASGEYTTTQFFVILTAIIFGGQGVTQFFAYTTSITKAKLAANYLLWLRTIKVNISESDENKDKKPSGDASIGVEDIHFRYKQRDAARVLRGISMKIEAGAHVAVVGPSGCGKSTIVSLLERFYDPISGRITLNGDDISLLSPHAYRQHMSLVQQEPPLYLGSVRENIAIGLDYEPSDEEVNEACRQANALEFVTSLPEGLSTACGAKGLRFSGGQRQRIAVARALIRKPRLLLLDEATSALDTQSERVVQKALDEAGMGRTTIAVAHRLSTIRNADVIFVMEDGKIIEVGTHEELQRRRGAYFAMCLAQSLDQAS